MFYFQLYSVEVLGDMKHLTQSRSENFRDKRQAKVNNMTFTVCFTIKNINECTLCQPNIFDNIKQYEEIKQMWMMMVLVYMIETVKQTSSKSMLDTRSLAPTAFFKIWRELSGREWASMLIILTLKQKPKLLDNELIYINTYRMFYCSRCRLDTFFLQ